jgi:hypothetical protein
MGIYKFKKHKMTNEQTSTAKQIVKEYYDLFDEKPIMVNMGDREIVVKRNGPVLHPYYKELANGNILFGVGTEYTSYDMFVIGINSWKIIKPNGAILEKTDYSVLETELAKQSIEIGPYSSGGDLIRF